LQEPMTCFVLDASAFFHARDMRVFAGPLYTTRQVAEELRDPMAQAALGDTPRAGWRRSTPEGSRSSGGGSADLSAADARSSS
jgi:UPF0271 protein